MDNDRRERALIAGAVSDLPEAEKLVVTGIYWEGASPEEVAAGLDIETSQVLELHRRALRRLSAALARMERQLTAAGQGLGPQVPDWDQIGRSFKGSQRRLQEWVGLRPDRLDEELRTCPTLDEFLSGSPHWLSPLRSSLYRELRDDLWRVAGLPGRTPQEDGFWPATGPVWDAVALLPGQSGSGLLLVEAKSHVGELKSEGCGANPTSLRTIEESLAAARAALRGQPGISWAATYYQLANRLSFLWYLREQRGIPTWVVWIYFVGDDFAGRHGRVVGPTELEGWGPAIAPAYSSLGLPEQHRLSEYAPKLFLEAAPPTPAGAVN